MKRYLLTGWSSHFVDPGFEFSFDTLEEAEAEAKKLLSHKAQTSLRIYQAELVSKGARRSSDETYVLIKESS